jgi:hypothetical protein
MPRDCQKCGGGKGPSYSVVLADGRKVFISKNESTANAVSRRYPGSSVEVTPKP